MNLKEYVQQRDELLSRPYDYESLVRLMRSVGSVPPPLELGEVVYHKARLASTGVEPQLQLDSAGWLKHHGYGRIG